MSEKPTEDELPGPTLVVEQQLWAIILQTAWVLIIRFGTDEGAFVGWLFIVGLSTLGWAVGYSEGRRATWTYVVRLAAWLAEEEAP